jgi:hypothetical protein
MFRPATKRRFGKHPKQAKPRRRAFDQYLCTQSLGSAVTRGRGRYRRNGALR